MKSVFFRICGVVSADLSFKEVSKPYARFFRSVGILPFEGRGFNFAVTQFLNVFVLICTFLNVSMAIGYNIETIIMVRSWELDEIYISILSVDVYFRYWLVLWRRKWFTELFEECARLWDFCDAKGRATVKRYEHKFRMFGGIYILNCYAMNVALPINAYFTKLPPLEANGTERRVLPFRCYVKDEPYKLLGYHATFIIQTVAIQTGITCAIATNAFIPIFTMISAGYFRQLADRLVNLRQQFEYSDVLRCIKYHQRLLQFYNDLNKFGRNMVLSQVMCNCYNISLVLMKLNGTDPGKYSHAPIIINCVFQLLMVQWTPDIIVDESEGVASAAYYAAMRRLDDKQHRGVLHITLTRAQIPVQFLAGGFLILSFETYASMMKGAFSFFMVLRSLDVH